MALRFMFYFDFFLNSRSFYIGVASLNAFGSLWAFSGPY